MKVDLNASLIDSEEAFLSVMDSGFLYGYAIYETFYVLHGKVAFFEEHISRFLQACDFLKINLKEGFSQLLKDRMKRLIHENQFQKGRLRFTFSSGTTLPWTEVVKPTELLSLHPLLNEANQIRLCISKYKKPTKTVLPPFVKYTANYPSVLSFREAKERGYDEALLVNSDEFLSEGSFCNLFFISKEGVLKTPSLDCAILDGVTRKMIIQAAKTLGIQIEEGKYRMDELLDAKFIYISSSTRGLMPAVCLEEKQYDYEEAYIAVETLQKSFLELQETSLTYF